MNIGLVSVDGHNFPNLALMKISAFHKRAGDNVTWATIGIYDRTYMSKVFTFTPNYERGLSDYGEVFRGGTGYGYSTLPPEIDAMCPDYSLYPMFKEAYGFLTRGCPNKCSWCIVPKKEGNIRPYADIEEFLDSRKAAILMDNNVLAHEHGLTQIEKIIRLKVRVDFNQGLDARLITDEIAQLLSRVRWYRPIRMACDTRSQMPHIETAVRLLRKHGATPSAYFVYVLVKDIPGALERVEFLRDLGCDPFAQPYIDFSGKVSVTKEQRRFARWVNHKAIFNSVPYEKYS